MEIQFLEIEFRSEENDSSKYIECENVNRFDRSWWEVLLEFNTHSPTKEEPLTQSYWERR